MFLSASLSLGGLDTLLRAGRACLDGIIGGCFNYGLGRLIGACHIRCTGRLLYSQHYTLARLPYDYNFTSGDTFCSTFDHVIKMSPLSCRARREEERRLRTMG